MTTQDVWSAQDTSPDEIEAALRSLLRERHAADASLAPARVLNLIVIADHDSKGTARARLERAGRYQASRTVLCTVQEGRTELDAVARMSYDEPRDGLSVVHESVEIDIGPEHLLALRTIVDPVLISEIPTVCWSPDGHADIVGELLPVIDVILLDSDDAPDPRTGFDRVRAIRDQAYVVDLAWLRTTPWRERLAASLGLRPQTLRGMRSLEVRHREGSSASALLLAGWLASRLDWERAPLSAGAGEVDLQGVERNRAGEIAVTLRRCVQDAPGLAGVTVEAADGAALALQRGHGGLDASEDVAGGERREFKILGASRGEAGILGEGIRQALLRDPTYGPALAAGREMCPSSPLPAPASDVSNHVP